MGFLDSMNISATALTASRLRMDVVAENIANANTTRTESGEPYRRKMVVYQEITDNDNTGAFSTVLKQTAGGTVYSSLLNRVGGNGVGGGVRVVEIAEDQSEFTLDYNPTHPDADENGYVRMPNVEIVQEMTDMMAAYRAYEANITALNTFKDMAVKTLELGK